MPIWPTVPGQVTRITPPRSNTAASAGGLCLQWLDEMGIRIGGKISEIAGIPDKDALDPLNPNLSAIPTDFPVLSAPSAKRMQEAIAQARTEGDSVGGVVECWITGLPAG